MADERLQIELAQAAARWVVEEGMDYSQAKHRAAKELGRRQGRSGDLPSNEMVEDEVREYIALFCADTQPAELRALREHAVRWMERLAVFHPHLGGAVWRGTATRLSCIMIDLYCDDPKAPEITLLNNGMDVESHGGDGQRDMGALTVAEYSRSLGDTVTLHFLVHDLNDLRGALQPDARGRSWRGDLTALRRLLDSP